MKIHSAPTAFAAGHKFLEGLRWHDGRLWASDFFSGEVLNFAADGTSTTIATIPGAPSGLGFHADGTTLVVSQADATIQRIGTDGSLSTYADFSHLAGGPGNDLLVSPEGHAYVGNFGFHMATEEPKPTVLAHVDPSGGVRPVDGDVLFPNGMSIAPDGVLLLAETFRHRITAYDIGNDGSLSGQRVWAQLEDSFMPDGIALDSDGGVWFGNALNLGDASGFYRVLEGGELTDKIPTPTAQAITCAFGGDDLNTLYLACNTTSLEEFVQGRSDGQIMIAKVGRSGVPGSAGARA